MRKRWICSIVMLRLQKKTSLKLGTRPCFRLISRIERRWEFRSLAKMVRTPKDSSGFGTSRTLSLSSWVWRFWMKQVLITFRISNISI